MPSSSLPTTASSVEEAFALVNQSFNAALDAEANDRAAQRAAVTPPAPIAAAGLGQIVDTQASAEGQLITQRAEAAQVGLTEEGQTPEATAQPAAAPAEAPAAPPISARLSRREADEEGPAPPTTDAAPAVEVTPAEGSAQAQSPVVTETSPSSPTAPSTTTSQAVVPPAVTPAQTEAPALDLPAEAASASGGDGELTSLEFDKANADRERELAQSDLQRLEARQKEAEARAKAEGHPEDLHNAPTPHELQSAKDRVARAEEDAKEAETALQSAQNAASAPSGGGGEGGGGGGGGANPEALAAEAQAQAEAAAAEQAAALGAETTADQAALTAQAQAARAQVLAQAQLLAEQVRAAATTQATAVRDAGAQAADAARAQAQAEAESARAAAEAAASQASNASGPFDGPEEESQAQAAAEAEAASIRAEGEAKAEELIAAGEAKAEQLITAAEAQAQQLIAQGELAAAQLIAAADAGAEAVAAQAALLTQQLQVNAAAHTAQLNAERDAAIVATETLLAEVEAAAPPVVEPVNNPVVVNSTPAETPLGPDERGVKLVSAPSSSGPTYPAPPGPAAPGEVVEPSVAAPYPRAAPQTSPLLDHLRGVTDSTLVDGPEAQAATAEALGVSVEALTVLQSNPSALTWSDLTAAGLSDADRAALQTAAAVDLASGLDPDQPANLFLSWFDWEIATQADFRATQPHLDNSIHLDNAGMDEVAALMGVAEFQRLVLSTHGLPGGQLMKPEDGPGHEVYDARVMADLAEQSGVDSVLLAHCYGALGADGVNTLDVDYRAASGSSIAEFAARGMDVSAYEGEVSSTTATTMVGLWSELLAAGVPDDAALQLAGAYANANGDENLNSIDWQHYAPHARAELGPENDPQAWANENGFVETQVNGERSTPAHMLPLLAEYGHLLMATPTVTNAPMAFTGNEAAGQADLFARMTINDLVYGGLYPSAGDSGQDAQMVVRLLEDAWTGAPLVQDGQLPSWATLGPRLYFALEGQVSAIEQMSPDQRAQNAAALENLQLMRDAVWIQLAAEGQGVTDEHGQMAFLPPTDLTVDPSSPSTATNATGNTTVVNGVTVADPTRIIAPDVSVDPLAPTQGLLFSEAISDGTTPVPPQAAALYTDLLTGNPDTIRAALDGALTLPPDQLAILSTYLPAMVQDLPPEAMQVVGLTLWEAGAEIDAAKRSGAELDAAIVEQNSILGQGWAEATAMNGLNPFGAEIHTTLAIDGEDWAAHAAEVQATFGVSFEGSWDDNQVAWGHYLAQNPGLWTDMGMPSTMWTFEGDLARYSGTTVMAFAGTDGIRVYRNGRTDLPSVTNQEMALGSSLTFFGPGALPDQGSALFKAGTLDQLEALGFTNAYVTERPDGTFALVPYERNAEGDPAVREGALLILDAQGNVVTDHDVDMAEAAALTEAAGVNLETREAAAAAEPEADEAALNQIESGWQGGASFVNGGVELEASQGHTQTSLSVNNGVEFSGLVPLSSFRDTALVAGPRISYQNGTLQAGGQLGVSTKIGDQELLALAYASMSFGQGGEITGVNAGGSAQYGGYNASLAVSFQDADFASYVAPDANGNPGMIFYGSTSGQSLGGGGAVPVGPFVVGADGSLSRSLTVQAFTSVQNLPGLDPTLAETDPRAFRDAVAAEMAGRTEGIETVSDLDPDTILGWAPGDGIIIEQTSGAGGGGTFGTLAVNVTAGAEEERTEQVTVARGDGNAVTITVTSLDADTFRAGLNAGPFGISGRDTDETASSVTFTIPDITTTEGRAALDMYLNAQALPGALDYAASTGVIPQNVDLTNPQAVAAYATEANRAYLDAQSSRETRGGPEVNGATYSEQSFSQAFQQSTSLSALGFALTSSMNRETWTDLLYNVDGDWQTNLLLDQQEQWMFSRDTHLSGVSVNPETGPFMSMYQQQDANSAWIRENGLTDLIDPNDPMSALFASGAFDNASVDGSPRMTLALGLEEDDLQAINTALDSQGEVDVRLEGMDEAIENRMRAFLNDNTDWGLSFDPVTGDVSLGPDVAEVPMDELAVYTGMTTEETVALFGDQADDPLFVAQTLADVANANPSDFATLPPIQQELYLRIGLSAYTEESPYLAKAEGSPFDVIALIADVQDDETRDMMLRRMFYAAEQQEEGAQGTLRFLQWAEQLPPELTASLREGATLQVDLPLTGPQDLLNELIDGGPGYGGADVSFTLDRMTPEQRTVYLDALPSLIDSQAFLTRYAEVHGEPFPYADAGPVAWMFLGMPDASSQAGMIAALQGTPYADALTSFAQAHPEQFLGAEVPIDYRQAAVTQLVNAGLDPTAFGVSATEALTLWTGT
ncbi:MAG: hypothetical protein IPO67_16805 [Deltaproteobacteria bacterium]|nr:hypothetical protein [Deltaproteobacteria bacterium]